MEDLETRVVQVIEAIPGQKAREIAVKLGIEREQVNSLLFGSLKSKVRQENYRWYPRKIGEREAVGEPPSEDGGIDPRIRRRIDEWRRKLVDISRRNRLLYYRPTKRSSLEIIEPDFQEVSDHILRLGEWRFWFPPEKGDQQDEGDELTLDLGEIVAATRQDSELATNAISTRELHRTLENLYRRSTTDYQERGVRILHLALGFLQWHDPERKEDVCSPLILIPVELRREAIGQPFHLCLSDEDPIVNPTLAVKLQRDFSVELPEIEGSLEAGDDDEYDLSTYFAAVEALYDGWTVQQACVLGLFTFYKEVMYRDLTQNWNIAIQNNFVGALARGDSMPEAGEPLPNEEDLDTIQSPEASLAVLDADSSQRMCLQAACQHKSFVIQGPPGTGKSQTIANLIAQSIADGRSVLFVSEKMAALEVVFKRLQAVGLAEFCLELHSHKANKREVAEALGRALRNRVKERRSMKPEDLDRLKQIQLQLNDYVIALHEERTPLGKTAYEMLGRLAQLLDAPAHAGPSIDSSSCTMASFNRLRSLSEMLAHRWSIAQEGESFPWRDYAERDWTAAKRQSLEDDLRNAWSALGNLRGHAAEFAKSVSLPAPPSLAQSKRLNGIGDLLNDVRQVPVGWLLDEDLASLRGEAAEWHRRSDRYLLLHNALNQDYAAEPTAKVSEGLLGSLKALDRVFRDAPKLLDERFANLTSFLRDLRTHAEAGQRAYKVVAPNLGLTVESPPLELATQIFEAADCLAHRLRPEPRWLSPSRMTEVVNFAALNRNKYEQQRVIAAELGLRYADEFILVGSQMAQRYEVDTQRPLARLSKQHRVDRKAIKALSKSGRLPETVQDDLKLATEAFALRKQLASVDAEAADLLGRFYNKLDTDFDALAMALVYAKKLIAICGNGDIGRLSASLSSKLTIEFELAVQSGAASADRAAELLRPWGDQLLERLEKYNQLQIIGWVDKTTSLLRQFHFYRNESTAVRRNGTVPTAVLRDDAARWLNIVELRVLFSTSKERFHAIFPFWQTEPDGEWQEIEDALAWASKFRETVPSASTEFAHSVVSQKFVESERQDLAESLKRAEESVDRFVDRFVNRSKEDWLKRLTGSWPEAHNWLKVAMERMDEVQSWLDYIEARSELSELGWGDFVSRLEEVPPPNEEVSRSLERAIHSAWLEDVFRKDSRLSRFRGQDHEVLIEEFRKLDARLIENAREEVIRACNARRPQDYGLPSSQVALVRSEAGKKRRHLPVRRLFARTPELLLQLKPCLLMSPLSVSQFLDPSMRFDVVIFDEASQVTVEDAICALYRSTQQIIAGDPKQLPPTSFFAIEDDLDELGDDEEDTAASWESILDQAESAGLRFMPLRWHYRSRHELLIAFSNKAFYGGDLVTFPSCWHEHPGLGVHLEFVANGLYDRGGSRTNKVEAARVAEIVFDHFRRFPKKSIGVVTFSQTQMTAVQDAIDQYRFHHRELEKLFDDDRLEGFFVKNLENVQGDERDIMIFSVGYGPDALGGFSTNLGPLNKDKGERRLNVAITRAREKVVLVSSIRARDFPIGTELRPGVFHLRNYLDFAERGPVALLADIEVNGGDFESEFEAAVAAVIRQSGLEIVPQVGVGRFRIDLGIVHPHEPGRFLAGVECDGFHYHSTSTARDRDRLRQEILQGLGWRIIRVWSPDWFRNHAKAVSKLKGELEQALQDGSSTPAALRKNKHQERAIEQLDFGDRGLEQLPGVVPYRHAILKPDAHLHIPFHEPSARKIQVQLLAELVQTEHPVTVEYAKRRLRNAWQIKREGSLVAATCDEVLAKLISTGQIEQVGQTLFSAGVRSIKEIRIPEPDSPETYRDLENEVPIEEITLALLTIVEHAYGISRETLIQQTSRLFGFKRTGSRIADILSQVVNELVSQSKLCDVNGQVILGRPDLRS